MSNTRGSITQPDNLSISLWRYMSLTRFKELLAGNRLYFRRADRFEDPYEGLFTDWMHTPEFRDIQISSILASGAADVDQAAEFFRILLSNAEINRASFFVNCWYAGRRETEAMWKLYTNQNNAVCIRTTYSNLFEILPESVTLGLVSYIDFDSKTAISLGNPFAPIYTKRDTYLHEREARATVWAPPNWSPGSDRLRPVGNLGYEVNVDPRSFIEEVFISPKAEAGFKDEVGQIAQSYSLSVPITKSGIYDRPWHTSAITRLRNTDHDP
jgi:hypothetical protein